MGWHGSDADKHFEVYWALLTVLMCFFGISFAYAAVRYENVRPRTCTATATPWRAATRALRA
jgi:hypothetical protein